MKRFQFLLAVVLTVGINAAHAAAASAPAAQTSKLPAGDNVQSQTQAKVRQTKPRPHHKSEKHRRSLEGSTVTQ